MADFFNRFNTQRNTMIGRILFIAFSIIIILHLVLFIVYTQLNKRSEAKVNRDLRVQQVVNLIERINYTPPMQRAKIVKTVEIPNLTISLDKTPLWSLRFSQGASLWQISQAIHLQQESIQMSLQYGPKSWLNISMPIENTSWWLQIFLLSLELIIVAAIILIFWSINRFAVPLKKFKKAAERLGVDLDAPPLPVYGPSIVQEASYAMNQLQQRIRELIQERTNLLAALSHDLKTPITRMKLRAQFIKDEELREKNLDDLDQMDAMITETLAFAKSSSDAEKYVKLDLTALLQSICNDFLDMNYPVSSEIPEQRLVIKGNGISLRRAFNNLIENAIKYGMVANIVLKNKAGHAIITVSDNGPGILEKHLSKVFEPFYRGESSRSRETGGTGLGLAVTKDVIKRHHGQVNLRNLKERGLEVKVILPLVK